MSSEHKVLDLKNRIEASIVIWKRKMHQKDGKSSWVPAVSLEKRELFEERAETILLLLKHRFPGIPQSAGCGTCCSGELLKGARKPSQHSYVAY